MAGPDWLIARPIAHRGLHNAAAGTIENTASAATAAIDGNYAIETRRADQRRRRGDDLSRRRSGAADRRTWPGRIDVRGRTQADCVQTHRRPHADARRILRSHRRPRDAGRRNQKPFRWRSSPRRAGYCRIEILRRTGGRDVIRSASRRQSCATMRRPWSAALSPSGSYDHPEWNFLAAGRRRNLA